MKHSRDQGVRDAQKELRALDALGEKADQLLSDLETCAPEGVCGEVYLSAFHQEIDAARAAATRAVAKSASLTSMAADARAKAARLLSYAEQREREAASALRISLSDARYK